jgi:hypothetical protein
LFAPLAVPYTYPYNFIVVPAFAIILAFSIALAVKYAFSKVKVGAVLAFFGLAEIFMGIPVLASVLGVVVAFATLITGLALCASPIALKTKKLASTAKAPAAFILIGLASIFIAIPTVSFWLVIIGLSALVIGIILGASYLTLRIKNPSLKAKIGATLIVVGVVEAFVVEPFVVVWGFIFGFIIMFAGIAVAAPSLEAWIRRHLTEQRTRSLKKGVYVVLAVVIVLSGSIISLRATNIVHEQRQVNFSGASSPNLDVQGVITDIKLNYEVNTGYSYHIFPAYITFKITGVTWESDEAGQNLTTANQYWVNREVIVAYEAPDVPELRVGQQVEVKGYYTFWMEDWLFSGMLVVAPSINDSYITSM